MEIEVAFDYACVSLEDEVAKDIKWALRVDQ